jgi:phage terminase small subunit
MRIRQMAFSSRLKAHRHLLTLETLKFISHFLESGNARLAALDSGIPELYASRQGAWLKKHPMVIASIERELEDREINQLKNKVQKIEELMEECKEILGLEIE